ncbi:hypothetical protein GMSM_08880 [Geomonas sp. Red276]
MLACALSFVCSANGWAEESLSGTEKVASQDGDKGHEYHTPLAGDEVPYPGALFDQFNVSDYAIGTIEYRRELFFFLYLHLSDTYMWADREIFSSPDRLY